VSRPFASVPVGDHFEHGGNLWRKRSMRTAEIIASRGRVGSEVGTVHRHYAGAWSYFRNLERVDHDVEEWAPRTKRASWWCP